jgi:hypothetical protein
MKPFCQVNKRYRQILIASLMSSGSLLPLLPALADPVSPNGGQNSAAPGEIQNQATAEFTDSADSTVVPILSDIVKVTVAEIAGISAAATTVLPINNNAGGTPTLYPTSTVYFDFIVKNEGNDPTKLFIPGVPSIATVGGTAVTAGQLTIVNYNTVAPVTGTVTTTAAGTAVPTATGVATNSVPAGGYVTVRVPITIPFGTARGADINVTLGNTSGQLSPSNTPYIVGANGTSTTTNTGGNDLYTQDNADGTNSDTTGVPFNGDASGHRQEASASQTVKVIVPTLVISGKVYDDANNTALNTFTNIQDGTESGAVVTPPVYAVLVDSSNKVIASTQVINNGTNGATGTNGTYSFTGVDGYQDGLYVILSSTTLAANTTVTPASATVPTGWTSTSPLIYPAFNVTNADTPALVTSYTLKDFGIEQLPTAVGFTVASQVNPTGVNEFTVPATVFTGSTDPDGTVASYKITAFPSNVITIKINGTSYTSATFPVGGVTFTLAQLTAGAVKVDPVDGASTVNILFQAIDNGGKLSTNTATGSLPFSAAAVTISGTVINDKDQSASGFSNIKTGTEGGTDTLFGTNGTPIYATLYNLDTNQVIATQVIPSTGIYSFPGISATTNVKVILSTTAGTAGSATAPTPGLPGGWKGTTVQDSGSFNTGLFDVANKDFGVIQKAKLVIVKRITKINGSTTNPNDNTPLTGTTTDSFNFNATKNPTAPTHIGNWPANYIVGATDAGKVKPGDFIEYTIYFMNNQGADAKNVKICDPIRGSQDYVPSTISLNLTSNPTAVGTAIGDTASRVNVFTGNTVPGNCNMGAAASTGTNNGGVAIDITTIGTATAATDQPVGIPGATSATAPGNDNTYGMFRFRTQVKP